MSVRVRKDFTWWSAAGLLGILMVFGGCESSQRIETDAEIDVYRRISDLEQQRQDLEQKITQQKDEIRALEAEHGAGHLDSRLELQVQRVAALTEEIVKIEAARTKLEVEVDVLKSIPSKSVEQEKRLQEAQIELRMARDFESRMRDIMAEEDAEAVALGRRKLAIGDLKEQLLANREQLEKVEQDISELELEKDKPKKKWLW